MLKIILLLATLVSLEARALPTFDDEFSCIDSTTAQKYVSDLKIDLSSFGGMDLCNSAVDTKKLLNDMSLVDQGRFAGDGSNTLIRGYVPADQYYSWLVSMTYGMERGNDIPWATAYNSGGYFTMQNGWAKLSTLGRVGTVLHEARHTAGYRHIPCSQGPYAGTNLDGCDRDYSYGGSHAVEMEYYARVALYGSNFHPVYKKMARLMAMGRSNFVFNQRVINPREAMMLVDSSNRILLVNNSRLTARDGNVQNRLLKRTSFGASLFDLTRAFAIDPYDLSQTSRDVNDDYSYFKLLGEDRGQGNTPIRDMEEVDLGVKRYFMILNTQGQVASYAFRNGRWGNLVSAPAGAAKFSPVGPSGERGLFTRSENGEVYQLNPDDLSRPTRLNQSWPSNVVTLVKDQNNTIAVMASGEMVDMATSSAFMPTRGMNVKQAVNIPLYDAFEVKP